jgi:hypothetical protein
MNTRDKIIHGMARALFVDDWARQQEERGRRWPARADLMDLAPRTPPRAVLAAARLARRIEQLNNTTMAKLYDRAVAAPERHLSEPTARLFGHYLAMESLGHGVSWFDDHPEFPLKLPHVEYYDGHLSI